MSNYFTQFSLIVPWPAEARQAIVQALRAKEDGEDGRPCEFEAREDRLHLYAEDNCLIDEVAAILATVQRTFKCPPIGIEYAMTCSGLDPDGFGGGAVAIRNGQVKAWGTGEWLTKALAPRSRPRTTGATATSR
jgi:hypothetical protein